MSASALATGPFGVPIARPTLLDRVVGYFNPREGVRRLHARTLLHLSGSYEGARTDRRELQGMTRSARGADADTIADLRTLRARSRELYRNAPLATGAIKTVATSVVGWGLDPQPRIDRALLGLSEEQARDWQRQARRLWWLWAGSASCDWAGLLTFAALTDLSLRSRLQSGDAFIVRQWREPRAGELFGTRLQLIEADRCCNPDFRADTPTLTAGVEMTPEGRPIAYHFLDRHPDDAGAVGGRWSRVLAIGPESGEQRVLHLWRPDRPHATRGVPYLAPVITALRKLHQYSDSELMAALVSSLFTVFIKHQETELGAAGPAGLQEPSGLPPSSQAAAVAAGQYRMGAGAMLDLNPGEDVAFANPMRPNASYDPFVLAIVREISVGLELPYELLIKHFTASYSASMAALQEAWRFFRTERYHLTDSLTQPAYEWVLGESVLRGYLAAPGFFENPLLRQAWCTTTWTGPARGHIQPAQEASAMETRLRIGVTTKDQEIAEHSGRDFDETLAQRALERRLEVEAGLDVEGQAERVRVETVEPVRPDPDEADRREREEAA